MRASKALAAALLAYTPLWSALWWHPVGVESRVVLFESPCCALDATAAEFSEEYGLPPDSVGAVLERAADECSSEQEPKPSHHRVQITVNMPVEPDVVRAAERGVAVNVEGGDAPHERITALEVSRTHDMRTEPNRTEPERNATQREDPAPQTPLNITPPS